MTQRPSDDIAARLHDPATAVRLRRQGVAWRTVFDDVIALNTESNQYHAVNETGRTLWTLLDQGTTVGDLTAALVDAHPDAAARAAGDVATFVSDLHDRGLVETSPPTP